MSVYLEVSARTRQRHEAQARKRRRKLESELEQAQQDERKAIGMNQRAQAALDWSNELLTKALARIVAARKALADD